MTMVKVPGDPYDWPFEGGFDLASTALLCIY